MAGQVAGTSFDEFTREHPDAMTPGPSDGAGPRGAPVTNRAGGSPPGTPGPGGDGAALSYTHDAAAG